MKAFVDQHQQNQHHPHQPNLPQSKVPSLVTSDDSPHYQITSHLLPAFSEFNVVT